MKVSNSISKAWHWLCGCKIKNYTSEQNTWMLHISENQTASWNKHNKSYNTHSIRLARPHGIIHLTRLYLKMTSVSPLFYTVQTITSIPLASRGGVGNRISSQNGYTFSHNRIQNASHVRRRIGLPTHSSQHTGVPTSSCVFIQHTNCSICSEALLQLLREPVAAGCWFQNLPLW